MFLVNISVVASLLLFICLFSLPLISGTSDDDLKTYIVYMGDPPKCDYEHVPSLHTTMLNDVIGRRIIRGRGEKKYLRSKASSSILYSYGKSFNGFAAKLNEEEMLRVSRMDGVVSVFENTKNQLHTTKSWDYMGFSQDVERRLNIESDIVVGVLDTGIWPESESFKDDGLRPPPKKWKGTCDPSFNFTCNNKIIGAKFYKAAGFPKKGKFVKSPRDSNGHGTHTASTAAGKLVSKASLMGLAKGTARGGVPSAHIAVYKICWADGCDDADILKAFDDAIDDGVDIISLSVGSRPRYYFRDSIAIGTFHAMKKGILTSASAGNEGPYPGSAGNTAPWILTVAASYIDRKFSTRVQLGNGMTYEGVSINTFDDKHKKWPIVYGEDVPNTKAGFPSSASRFCIENSLDRKLVKGKIVLCDQTGNGAAAVMAGAAGLVARDDGSKDNFWSFPLPATYLGVDDGAKVFEYLNSTRDPTATIFKSTEVREPLAPFVASFSSKGPNLVTLELLKPDITAPGVGILAAWSELSTPSEALGDNRHVPYNIISGTSMSCPHVTGVAAYLKSFHPSWSAAAIKSALMTTAYPLNSTMDELAEFSYGAGHIDPIKALNPGLVYDATPKDYIKFLCGQGYNSTTLGLVSGEKITCNKATTGAVWDLNVPSFAYPSILNKAFTRKFSRTVTNVGSANSKYTVKIMVPKGLNIEVKPSVLLFTSLGQKLSFVMTIQGVIDRDIMSASLIWEDGKHKVRSPIVLYDTST